MLDEVVDELKKYNIFDINIFRPTYKKEISLYINKNIHRFDLLILFGGDGTLNETINGLMISDRNVKLLYIPSGTVNDFGNYLKIPSDYKEAFALLKNDAVGIDICQVNEMYFSYVLACGKFTNVSYGGNYKNNKKALGKFYYYFRALKELFKFSKIKFIINNSIEKRYALMLGLNIYRVAGFNIRNKKNKLNDGNINVVFFKSTIFFSTLAIGLFLVFGIVLKGMVEVYTSNKFEISSNLKQQFNTDGEESYFTDYVNIKVIKEALRIYLPPESIKKYFK